MRWDDDTAQEIAARIRARRTEQERRDRRAWRLDILTTGLALVAFTVAVGTLNQYAIAAAAVALVVCLIVASSRS